MTLDHWLATPLAHALGRALMHFLWEGALLAAALGAVMLLGAARSARWRHQVATACLLALPLAFGLTVALSLSAGHSSVVALPPAAPRLVLNPVIAAGAPAAPIDRLAWLAPLWMGGVILFYVFRMAGWLRVDRMRRRGVCAAPAEWQQRLHALAAAVRVSQPVVLLESCLAGVPVVIGYWRPVILMPLGALTGLSAEQVEAILIHELAHIRRADYLVSLAQSAIEGLFFFHPAVWWISAVVRAEREYSCDDVVVALRPDARAYAAALTTLEQSRWAALEAAPAANGGNLVKRIRRLLGEPAPARVPNARVSALAGALVLVAAVATALVVWPPARSFAQATSNAVAVSGKQEPAEGFEQARRNLAELQQELTGKQAEIQVAEKAIEDAQQVLRRNAAELERAFQNGGGLTGQFGQHEEQLRQALQQLEAALAGKFQEVFRQQEREIQRAEKQLQQADKEMEAAQAGQSQELFEQQERALQQVEKQLQELTNGKLDAVLRQQKVQAEQVDLALKQMRAAIGEKVQAELEKQLRLAQKELEHVSGSWGQEHGELRAQAQAAETPRPEAKAESESASQKWLNEDVVYIIADRERRAFLALRTDAERERFIEQFWLRRDPPGSGPNAFKQEHYRRIAYANEHYASSVPGWRTDRGRIYIVYGPPDEIEDHSAESTPRQDWLYVHIDGIGYAVEVEFSDLGRTGDLRMVAAPGSHGTYWQVMADASDAAGYAARSLRAKGFPAITYPVRADRPSLIRVLVGPYADEAALAKAKAALEAAGYHPTKVQ